MVVRHGETYAHTWRPTIAGLQWLGDMVRHMGTGTLMVVGVAVVGKSRETCT